MEREGRGGRLKGPAAEEPGAAAADGFSYRETLSMTFDRAWPGNDRQFIAADRSITHANDGFLRTKIKRDEFIRLADPNRFGHTRQVLKTRRIDGRLIAGDANGRAGRAGHRVRF